MLSDTYESRSRGTEIIRDSHTQQFVVVHNQVARDARLSRAARGLLIEILSMAPGQRITSATLQDGGPEGRDAIRRMLRDLESAGYIVRERYQDERGRWHTRLRVYETPNQSSNQPIPPQNHVSAGRTEDGFPGVGNPGAKELKDEDLKDVRSEDRSTDGPGGSSASRSSPQDTQHHPASGDHIPAGQEPSDDARRLKLVRDGAAKAGKPLTGFADTDVLTIWDGYVKDAQPRSPSFFAAIFAGMRDGEHIYETAQLYIRKRQLREEIWFPPPAQPASCRCPWPGARSTRCPDHNPNRRVA